MLCSVLKNQDEFKERVVGCLEAPSAMWGGSHLRSNLGEFSKGCSIFHFAVLGYARLEVIALGLIRSRCFRSHLWGWMSFNCQSSTFFLPVLR